MFDLFWRLFSKDLAMDLGTANTLVYVKGESILVNEPSIVVIDEKKDEVVSIGHEAKKLYGKTPKGITAIRPMKDGVIADFGVTRVMIKYFIEKAQQRKSLLRPKIIICVPSGITSVEKKAVIDSAEQAGTREVFLIEEPMAAAIGSNMPVTEAVGNLVVDIGGGTTDVAIISMAGVVCSNSVRVAGDEIDEAIMHYLKTKYSLVIGFNAAEQIKMALASAYPLEEEKSMEIKGMDLAQGIPKTLIINDSEIREAIKEPVQAILKSIKDVLEQAPPELGADIVERGVVLTGGGSLLMGLDKLITQQTKIPTIITDEPLLSVVKGTGKVLEDPELMKKVTIN